MYLWRFFFIILSLYTACIFLLFLILVDNIMFVKNVLVILFIAKSNEFLFKLSLHSTQLTLLIVYTQHGPLSLFQNLELGIVSAIAKCHFALSSARSCRFQCVFKSLSKHFKRFNKSNDHLSLTVRGHTSYKQTRDILLHKLS